MRWISLIALGLTASAPSVASAGLMNLGTANDFNVFVLGNDTQSGTDVQGRVAVGGDALFGGSGLAVATSRGGSTTNNLVVGRDYSNTYNSVGGNVVVGRDATINGPTIAGNLSVGRNLTLSNYGTIGGNVTYGTSLANPNTTVRGVVAKGPVASPIDFNAERSNLIGLSSSLAGLTPSGTARFSGNSATGAMGRFTLTGTDSALGVFQIRGADLALANGFTISAPAGSTVVINVDGEADRMRNFGFNLVGVDRQRVVFNFSRATSLDLSGIGIQGSILAPLAAVTFNNGNIDGTLIAGSLSGNGESHDYAFRGDFSPGLGPTPASIAVPEPAAALSTLTGLVLAGGAAWRRRRRRAGLTR